MNALEAHEVIADADSWESYLASVFPLTHEEYR
jgi:hypothetical protein